MNNPFDQFDDASGGANPFDQFDTAEPEATGESVPKRKEPKRKRTIYGEVAGFMANVNRGLGIGDELAAVGGTAINALTGQGPQGLRANLAAQRDLEDDYRADRPKAAALATGTGNALTMAVPAGPGAAAFANGSRAANALRGATVAGLSGAGYAAVDRGTLDERLAAAARTARDPVVLGLGAGAGAIAGRQSRPEAPTLDELRIARDDAYRAVDESGVQYSADEFAGLVDNIIEGMRSARFNPRLQQRAAIMLDEINDMANRASGTSPTLSELDDLRKVIARDVSSSNDPGERRMGQVMREQIDAFIDRAGDSTDILRARDMNTRVRKLESLDGLDDAAADRAGATGAGGNVNNATRQNVIRFQNATGNLTPAEQAAAQRVIRGTPTGNALRQVGKLSPEGNGLMMGGHLMASGATGGASNAVAGAGFVAKRVSDAITRRNLEELRRIIAMGGEEAGEVQRQLYTGAGAEDLREQLANDLAVAAGVQGASRPAIEIDVTRSTNPEHLAWRRANGLQ